MLNQTLCTLNNHFGDSFMMFRQFVKGGIDHFNVRPCHRLLHVRYLLRTFIDQENDQMQVRIIFLYRHGHFF